MKSEPGFRLVLVEEDLFEVEVEDVKFEEGVIHKALKHMNSSLLVWSASRPTNSS